MKKAAFFVLLALVSFLASCTSIPLSTMWRFRNYSEENIKEIDPELFRARVTHLSIFVVNPKDTIFELDLKDDVNDFHFEIPLEVAGTEDITRGVFRKRKFTKTMLKMSEEGIKDFIRLREEALKVRESNLLKKPNPRGYTYKRHFSVICAFEELAKDVEMPKYMELNVEVKLNGDEDFLTLIDNAKFEMKPTEEVSKK